MDLYYRGIDYNRAKILEKLADKVIEAGGKVRFEDAGVAIHSRGLDEKIFDAKRRAEMIGEHMKTIDDLEKAEKLRELKKEAEEEANALTEEQKKIPVINSRLKGRYSFGGGSIHFVLGSVYFVFEFAENPFFDDLYEKIALDGNGYTGDYYRDPFGSLESGKPGKPYMADELWNPCASEELTDDIAAMIFDGLMEKPFSEKVRPEKKKIRVANTYNGGYHMETLYEKVREKRKELSWLAAN